MARLSRLRPLQSFQLRAPEITPGAIWDKPGAHDSLMTARRRWKRIMGPSILKYFLISAPADLMTPASMMRNLGASRSTSKFYNTCARIFKIEDILRVHSDLHAGDSTPFPICDSHMTIEIAFRQAHRQIQSGHIFTIACMFFVVTDLFITSKTNFSISPSDLWISLSPTTFALAAFPGVSDDQHHPSEEAKGERLPARLDIAHAGARRYDSRRNTAPQGPAQTARGEGKRTRPGG